MDNVLEYVKSIFFIYIFISIICNLISNEKYARYIKLFTGMILIAAIIRPLTGCNDKNIVVDNLLNGYEKYQVNEEVYRNIVAAEGASNQEMMDLYIDTIKEKVESCVQEWGYIVLESDIRINTDTDSREYGSVEMITALIGKKDEETAVRTDIVEKIEKVEIDISEGDTNSSEDNRDNASSTGINTAKDIVSENYIIVSIKNNLANFYNTQTGNIHINIYDRHGD